MNLRLHHWNAQRDHTHAARSVRAKKPAYAMKPHGALGTHHQCCKIIVMSLIVYNVNFDVSTW